MNKTLCPLSNHLAFLLKCICLFIKTYIFYSGLRLGGFELVFSAASCVIFTLVYLVAQLFSQKNANRLSTAIYCTVSVIMAVDSVYFGYVWHLPSITQLFYATQLTKVGNTIMELIKPEHILMLIDLPLLFLFSVNRKMLADKAKRYPVGRMIINLLQRPISRKAVTSVTSILLAFFILVFPFYPEFQLKYMSNELFCYHISDIISAAVSGRSERVVDKSLYTSPDYSDSEYYGIAGGRNVIILQVEALQNFMIGEFYNGQEITPTLNKLISGDSFYFDNYYYQIGGGNTADAEFTVNNSLFAPETEAAYIKYADNTYNGLPYLLKQNGYSGAHAFHNYIGSFWNREAAYPAQGFDSFTSLEDMEQNDMFALGLSDKEMFRQTIPQLMSYEEPFYAFYVTVSSHHPYGIPEKDREIVIAPEDAGTLYGLYLQAVNYADRAIGEFIDQLDAAGLYENSIIVIYGDHYALTNTDIANSTRVAALTGETYSTFDQFNVPLIINIPGMEYSETIHTAGGHIDVMPTLLCLLGIHNDKTVMFGQNLLEAESGLVCEQAHVSIGSFISDEVFFRKPHNNIKSNYDAYEKGTMARLDPDLFEEQSKLAENRILDCSALMEKNDILLD